MTFRQAALCTTQFQRIRCRRRLYMLCLQGRNWYQRQLRKIHLHRRFALDLDCGYWLDLTFI